MFDGGTGIGHLRRLSSIARCLQGKFACLIVTGHRAAANWFVPAECEYVHVPAWDSLLADKADYWGRRPFIDLTPEAATKFRTEVIQGIVDAFQPDAIIVDHLPLGMREELSSIIANTPCKKYLVTRAVQNETEDLERLLLAGEALGAIEQHYDRVFLAIDERVFGLQAEYPQLARIDHKFCSVGYVVDTSLTRDREATRQQRGLSTDQTWVVASAGGGQHGESLIESSCALAIAHPDIAFDVIVGPRSSLSLEAMKQDMPHSPNLRLHKEIANLSALHAAADITISSGGYNSLLESLQGTARVLVVPSRKDRRDEQYVHAKRLSQFASIDVDPDVSNLSAMFAAALEALTRGEASDDRSKLNLAGAENIKRFLLEDLEMDSADEGRDANLP